MPKLGPLPCPPYHAFALPAVLSAILIAFGLRAACAEDPGAVPLAKDKTSAGPVTVVRDGKFDFRVLVSGTQVLKQKDRQNITIAAAFPDWENPATVVVDIDQGGNSCLNHFRVLDVKARKITAEFGNCWHMALREGKQELVFGFYGDPSPMGWAYGARGLLPIPRVTPKQHVRIGTAAYLRRDFATALRHLWLVRGERFAEPSYLLGRMAELGNGVRQDYAVAMQHYQQAAERDYAPAFLRIGDLHANGRGVAKDPAEAVRWYLKAAELGEGLAQYNVGIGFLTGNGVEKDPGRALFWLLVASERLTDRKLVASARKSIRMAESELAASDIQRIRKDAASWKAQTVTRWREPPELRKRIGKYNYERVHGMTLFEIPEIERRVSMMLGSNAIEQMTRMSLSGPAVEHSGWLIAAGCKPHQCSFGNWSLAINLSDYSMFACLLPLDSEKMIFGATGKKSVVVPRGNYQRCDHDQPLQTYLTVFSSAGAPVAPGQPAQRP